MSESSNGKQQECGESHDLYHYTGDLSKGLWFGRCLLASLAVLFLMDLGSTGFLLPDEPRYASIGRAMAETGDLITPGLDGAGWFEKPPLLYWTTAAALRFGLHDEWAARLPMALLSIAFLAFFYTFLRRELSPAHRPDRNRNPGDLGRLDRLQLRRRSRPSHVGRTQRSSAAHHFR